MDDIDINKLKSLLTELRPKLLENEKNSIESDTSERTKPNPQNNQQNEYSNDDKSREGKSADDNSESSVNILGFDIDSDNLKKSGLDPNMIKSIFKTYGETDVLLYEKLKKSFEILEKREIEKKIMKRIFFGVILFLLSIIVISPIFTVLLFLIFPTDNMLALVTTIIATLAEVLAGIIVLPNVIAEYLFNKKEDKKYFNLIRDLKDYHSNKIDHFNNKE